MNKRGNLWFILPSSLVMLVIIIYPLYYAIKMSFYSYYLPSPPPFFIGLGNYIDILTDSIFWSSMKVTFHFVAVDIALQLVLGITVALMLDKVTKGKGIFTTLILLPLAVTPVVGGLFMRWLFIPDWGMLNYFLSLIGISGPSWLADSDWALYSIVLADTWQQTPFVILVLYAGLQSLPQEPIEAAMVDGATGFNQLRHIILPLLKPLILFVLVMRTMDAFRIFDTIIAMTGGGPGMSTEAVTVYNYRLAFRSLEIGMASAVGVITLLILAVFIWLYIRFLAAVNEEA